MHPLVPPLILEKHAAGIRSGSFEAAGLFVDISGFSAMTDALMARGQQGAEILAGIMRAVLDPLIETVYAQGGFIAASAGDSLTALFPADDHLRAAAERAAAAAHIIQQSRARQPVFETDGETFRVSAKVGVAVGGVLWGIVASPTGSRGTFYFRGSAVDASAEAEHHARAGEIIITGEAQELLRDQVETKTVDGEEGRYFQVIRLLFAPPDRQRYEPPAVDTSGMRMFYPDSVLSLESTGDFRSAVSLFISLPSVRTETQLEIFLQSLFTLQEIFGGLINRLDFGDKGTTLLLFWGAPAAYENDIERALSFILDLQAATSIPISAGVTYRIAHAGFIGGRLHEEYTCFGIGVSLAARLMAGAPRGEIRLDEPAARRAARRFNLEELGPMQFKGFQEPQPVFLLLDRKETTEFRYEGGFAGRQEELRALENFIAPLASGQPAGLVVISGEPGIGKSRFVHEFLDSSGDRFQALIGQTDEILRQPLSPFVYWLRQYLGVSPAQAEARGKRSFNRKIDDLIAATTNPQIADELDRTRSFIGALVDLHWPDSLYEQLEAERRHQNTFIALATLIQAESLRQPVVLVLEDLHNIDDESRAFILHLHRVVRAGGGATYPVALVATSRAPLDRLGLEGIDCCEIVLPGLSRAELRQIARALLGGDPADSLLDLLEARADGNPFYAEQIVRYLQGQGRLAQSEGGWAATGAPETILPEDINALLVARLDLLARELREVILTASVLGREFDVRVLAWMLDPHRDGPTPPPGEVTAAEDEGIWSALTEIRYLFRHMLMRDAAYQTQVVARRQMMHSLALSAYESLYGEAPQGSYAVMAYHARQAGLREKAQRYLFLAGKEAAAAFQVSQALDLFTQALELTPEADAEMRWEILKSRMNLYGQSRQLNQYRQEILNMEPLLPVLNDVEKTVQWHFSNAIDYMDHGQYPEAEAHTQSAMKLIDPERMVRLAGSAYLQLATIYNRQSRLEEAAHFGRLALEKTEASGDQSTQAKALNILGLIHTNQARFAEGRQYLEQARRVTREIGNWPLEGIVLNNLGKNAGDQGDHAAARAYLQESLENARRIGDRLGESITLLNLGAATSTFGEAEQSLAYTQGALAIAREIGYKFAQAYALINLSSAAGSAGRHLEAEKHAREVIALGQDIGDPSAEAYGHTLLGHHLRMQGALDEADEAYRQGLALRQELKQAELASEPAAGLALTALERGDLPGAQRVLQPVIDLITTGGSLNGAEEPLRVYDAVYRVLSLSGDSHAGQVLETAHRLLLEQQALIASEEGRQAFLDWSPHHRAIHEAWQARKG